MSTDQSKLREFLGKYYDSTSTSERLGVAKEYAEKPTMVPVTKVLQNGYSVTYYVGQTDISVGNFPLSLDPHTAEELAEKWGCWLPTGKVVSQIHSVAREQGTDVNPDLLSASGYRDPITGEYHSPEDVVSDVSRHSAIIEYAERVEKALSAIDPGSNKVTVTNGKIIIAPTEDSDLSTEDARVFFRGIPTRVRRNERGEIEVDFAQQGLGASPHRTSRKQPYMEYCTFIRLVDNKVLVRRPDGSTYETTYPEALRNENTYQAFSDKPIQKIKTYAPRSEASLTATTTPTDQKPSEKSVAPMEKARELAEGAGKWVGETASDVGQWVGEKAEEAKKWLGSVFSDAKSFELLAISELNKTKLEKFSAKRKIKNRNG